MIANTDPNADETRFMIANTNPNADETRFVIAVTDPNRHTERTPGSETRRRTRCGGGKGFFLIV